MNEYYKKFEKFDKGNCSTVVIGKDASVTGKVILGHNEDDSDSIVELHLVPRMKHRRVKQFHLKTPTQLSRRCRKHILIIGRKFAAKAEYLLPTVL